MGNRNFFFLLKPFFFRFFKIVKNFGATQVRVDDIMRQRADVLAPCALGAVLNSETIAELQVPIVAGAANNQLAHEESGVFELYERDILYAPDYVINAGGLMSVYNELVSQSKDQAMEQAAGIYETIGHILTSVLPFSAPTGLPGTRDRQHHGWGGGRRRCAGGVQSTLRRERNN